LRIVLAAILGCACSRWLPAAELGRLEGTVRDGSQAVVPGTLVSSIQEETGFQFVATASGNGNSTSPCPPATTTSPPAGWGFARCLA